MDQVANGSTQRNIERPGTEDGGTTLRPRRRHGWRVAAEPVHRPVGERHIGLHAVVRPIRAHRLDADAREADLTMVVEHPEAHRVAHLGVGGALGEHLLPVRIDAPGQVGCHVIFSCHVFLFTQRSAWAT